MHSENSQPTVPLRNMSYRKPAPIYIPSPPASPRTSLGHQVVVEAVEKNIPPLPSDWEEAIVVANADIASLAVVLSGKLEDIEKTTQQSEKAGPLLPSDSVAKVKTRDISGELPPLPCEALNKNKDVPPLPSNWQEIVMEKTSEDIKQREEMGLQNTTGIKISVQSYDREKVQALQDTSFQSQQNLGLNAQGDGSSYTTVPGSHRSRRRGFPHEYRPPTPPLRSRSRRTESSQTGVEKTSQTKQMAAETYFPSENRSDRYQMNYARTMGSLTVSPSFRTERTAFSVAPSGMGWSHRSASVSESGLYGITISYPAPLTPQRRAPSAGLSNFHGDRRKCEYRHSKTSFREGIQKWARKVWRLMTRLNK